MDPRLVRNSGRYDPAFHAASTVGRWADELEASGHPTQALMARRVGGISGRLVGASPWLGPAAVGLAMAPGAIAEGYSDLDGAGAASQAGATGVGALIAGEFGRRLGRLGSKRVDWVTAPLAAFVGGGVGGQLAAGANSMVRNSIDTDPTGTLAELVDPFTRSAYDRQLAEQEFLFAKQSDNPVLRELGDRAELAKRQQINSILEQQHLAALQQLALS